MEDAAFGERRNAATPHAANVQHWAHFILLTSKYLQPSKAEKPTILYAAATSNLQTHYQYNANKRQLKPNVFKRTEYCWGAVRSWNWTSTIKRTSLLFLCSASIPLELILGIIRAVAQTGGGGGTRASPLA